MNTTEEKTTITNDIFNHFDKWIRQRAGLDRNDYYSPCDSREQRISGRRALAQEQRSIAQDRKRARAALQTATEYPFDAQAMQESFRAFSGRLEWNGERLEYTTGQYFPTEFAKAAASVLEAYVDAVRPKHPPAEGARFTSVDDIERAAHNAGSHWFEASTKRFFRSRILPEVYSGKGGIYFVSSEKGPSEERRYTVRKFDPKTADIDTFGPFNELSKAQAQRAARIAAHEPAAATTLKIQQMVITGLSVSTKKTP